ncbi:hypothetical protein [Elusimicrobium simillimum]|uniref:putative barnase/colicin E5 family endoribonuclease n=1 Tax=Elusimicrobium simillimum TaxID=3143438 RepID=UPI003C6FEE98
MVKDLRDDLEQYGGSNDVALKWGENDADNKGYGLKHIAEKHGQEVVSKVIEVLVDGDVSKFVRAKKTVHLEKNGYEAILSLDEHGQKKTWLLTGYRIERNKKTS